MLSNKSQNCTIFACVILWEIVGGCPYDAKEEGGGQC
jgi:hypothetical protein